MATSTSPDPVEIVIPLHVEDVSVERRKVERDVRVHIRSTAHDQLIDEPLDHERVEIERVAIGRPVDAVPPVREEGDTTVISVVEEVLVVERRLVLKEEIRLRRVRTTERHRETVRLREQVVTIERAEPGERKSGPPAELAPIPKHQALKGSSQMADETIVAVYDTAEHASLAVRDLEAAGVPSSAISKHAQTEATAGSSTTAAPARDKGFWSSLFGGEPEYEHDTTVYDRSMSAGSTVVTVRAPEQHLTQVMDILERHNPIDLDERAASYGLTSGSTTTTTTAPLTTGAATTGTATTGTSTTGTAAMGASTATGTASASGQTSGVQGRGEEVIALAEEQLSVGKRLVNRGTTRIRRFVVETPVEEAVTLHSEHVSVERRPVTGDAKVTDADFTDRTIDVTETDEEAVVAKTARVKEEVVVNKAATDRVETVRDTVRREDVEITRDGERTTTESGTTIPTPPNTRPKV